MGSFIEPSTVTAGNQSFFSLLTALEDVSTSAIARQGLTILRIFFDLRLNSTSATFSAEGAWGIIRTDGDQLAGLAFPDPLMDIDAPWMIWQRRAYLPASDATQQQHFDIKARRRLQGNDSGLTFVIDNDDASEAIEFTAGWRVLIGLP